MSLSAKNLCCARDDRELFADLSLNVPAGKVMQVEGRNGAGKTTLLRMLCGARLPDSGDVYWNGEPITDLGSDYFRQVNYVGHLAGVKRELSPEENLKFASAMHDAPARLSLDDVLDAVGLRGFEDVPAAFLSAGQTRRVALARLLLLQAPLWILDEPFTALDVDGLKMFEDMLEQHLADGGSAVLTTHRPVELHANRVVGLRIGDDR